MKVSPYHEQDKPFYSFYELFNDPLIQSKYVVHPNSKKDGAEEFLQELINNDKFITFLSAETQSSRSVVGRSRHLFSEYTQIYKKSFR